MIWVRRTADDVPEKISRSSIKGSISKQQSLTKQDRDSNSFSNPAFTIPEDNTYEIPQNSSTPGYVTVGATTYEQPASKITKLTKSKSRSGKTDPELATAVYNM